MRAFDRRDDIHSAENGPPAMTAVSRKWPRFGQRFMLEHFSAACPVSLLRVRYSGSLRGRLHPCTMESGSARIDPHTVFALAPCAISLKNALGPRRFCARDEAAAPVAREALNPPAARAPKRRADSGAPRSA